MKDGISIVLCTYNGAALLPATLRYIAHQQVCGDLAWEVIVVDNASTDQSAKVAIQEWVSHACPAPLRVVYQPKPGLSFARELGFAEAQYAYIVLCDDDNWLASNYIETAYDIMEQRPAIGMLGGWGTFAYETPPPNWVLAHPIHAGGPQAPATGRADYYGLYGAGSVMRKKAYLAIRRAGFQFLLTDRLGTQLSSGGDFELCHGVAMAGYLIWYDERLQFIHFITAGRITWPYYVNYLTENAVSFTVLEPYKIFLDTDSDKLLTYAVSLLYHAAYYAASLIYNVLIKQIKRLTGDDEKISTLKIITLKARVRSYKHWCQMGRNFRIAVKFRQQYTTMLQADGNTTEPVTFRNELAP